MPVAGGGSTSFPGYILETLYFGISPTAGGGGLELKLHKEESKYTKAKPRCTCFPPSATSTQC